MNVNGTENGKTTLHVVLEDFETSKVSGWGRRHQQCLILFCCLTTALSMRACMGVALVAMVEHTANTTQVEYNATDVTVVHNVNGSYVKVPITEVRTNMSSMETFLHALLLIPPYPKFQWPKKTQDIISSSFFWGYMLLQIPGGQLAHQFGARYLLTGALLINCVLCFSLPWAALYGGWILMAIFRIVQGLTQACLLPGVHTILGKWTPLEERGRLAGWAYGGSIFGTVLGLTVTGFIASSPAGWPGIFRFYGILSGIVGSGMWIFGADTPAQHKTISVAERRYIEERLGVGKKKHPVPWGKILRCRGMWAIMSAHIGQAWGQLTFYTEVPAFMDKVMGVNIRANGVLTALPYLIMWFANFFYTWFSDMLIVKKILNVANTRKLANSIGSVLPAIGFVVLAYVPKSNIYVVETVLIAICIFKIASNVGYHINHIDITNNYSGTLISLSNFASNLFGSQAPIVAGFILTDVTSEYQWRKVFYVAASFYFFTNLFYVVFGEGEKAEWDNPPEDQDDKKQDPSEMEPMIKEDTTKKQ
ncbi:putative inorganic phosphate cotransporter [Maniola jurtina]|uniref:putative inorganic phosphate cotransporter n=1 Tax=Maniola jurtina TaxID=191418 RepID=UPI001E689E90|nr:putative inorganic phosphate cotransporter [Maniola jurtina]XP_045772823.1 putative inorganic phosphate cotransporter [Maniola jurtina]